MLSNLTHEPASTDPDFKPWKELRSMRRTSLPHHGNFRPRIGYHGQGNSIWPRARMRSAGWVMEVHWRGVGVSVLRTQADVRVSECTRRASAKRHRAGGPPACREIVDIGGGARIRNGVSQFQKKSIALSVCLGSS